MTNEDTAMQADESMKDPVELLVAGADTETKDKAMEDKDVDAHSPPPLPPPSSPPPPSTEETTKGKEDTIATAPFDVNAEIQVTIKSMESLRASMSEVIAFPTASNYSRMLLRSKNALQAMDTISQAVETGDSSSSASASSSVALDQGSRSKLNAFGTTYWNIIQKHPELFMDTVSDTDNHDRDHDHSLAIAGEEDSGKEATSLELERFRGASSGFIRALACRLILIDKFHTMSRPIPALVHVRSRPIALSSELEFGLKCFCRAGKAILAHSEEYDVAFQILSLVVVCWDGIQASHLQEGGEEMEHDNGNGNVSRSFLGDYDGGEAFDALLLLPDCAAKMVSNRVDASIIVEKDVLEGGYHEASENVISQLQRLEEFVNKQIGIMGLEEGERASNGPGIHQHLFAMQHYLPSLARVAYKHGNRFAQLQDYNAGQEVMRISLTATDKCLARIGQEKAKKCLAPSQNREHAMHALEIQEQEMLVVSKQSFHILSHVCRSVKKFEDAKHCLDRIEAYLDEQRKHDDEFYNDTMSQLTKSLSLQSTSSVFALEGPQKQDAEEIKSRAQIARDKARLGEACERVNLAFSKIDLRHKSCVALAATDHTFIDEQFKSIIDCSKKFISGYSGELQFAPRSKSCDKVDAIFRTILGAARMISFRRFSSKEGETMQLHDPYEVFIASMLDDNPAQVSVYLEALHATIMAAKAARDSHTYSTVKLQTGLDQRAIGMGKKLSGMLRSLRDGPLSKVNNNAQSNSTLFITPAPANTGLEPLFETARDYCTKAVSIYQGLEECSDQILEWCEILIDILHIWRQINQPGEGGITEEQCDKVIAGVMAIKAHAESMSRSYGSALKTARCAWEKDGTHLGTLVTLFECSMRYESFSHTDIMTDEKNANKLPFSDTLLELDNSITVYLSLSKLENLDGVQAMQSLLEVFSVMCKLALDYDLLLLGLQRRMIELATKVASLTLPSKLKSNLSNEFAGSKCSSNSIFDVLRAYLATFEELLPIYVSGVEGKSHVDEFQCLKHTVGCVLEVLIGIRDCGEKREEREEQATCDFAFHDDPSFLDKTKKDTSTINGGAQYIFDLKVVNSIVGTQGECLWIAEQLWNISNQIMTSVVPVNKKRYIAELVADYLRDAHDFALLSEEEENMFLTRGHLGRESFGVHTSGCISFFSKEMGSDLCSEFSAQCLLSSVANVIDANNCETSESVQTLEISKCLVAAMAELRTLEMMENAEVEAATAWLSLNVLIAMQDDESCSIALVNGGILDKLTSILNTFQNSSGAKDQFAEMPPVDQLFLLANQAQRFGMQSSAKHLYIICAEAMHKAKRAFVIQENCTIGLVQRHIIALSSTVSEVVNTFDSVDRTMKSSEFTGSYTVADIDYFVVEAHNRACSLVFMGDAPNAERLLTVAMNLLPHSSKSVECFGSAIRRTYRSVIGREGIGGGALTLTVGNMISFFEK